MGFARSRRLARRSQRRLPRATIHDAAPCEAKRSLRRISAIAAGREHPGQRDGAWFEREIGPKLDAFALKEIGKATGLSLAACSRIRARTRVPRRRHWDSLLAMVETGN
jgi:hypothetical protein